RVIKILSVTNGLADLDVTGDGVADTGAALTDLGINDAERGRLAGLYAPGQGLWRVRIPHFSPWDLNWAFGPPPGALPPGNDPNRRRLLDQACTQTGSSVIECQNQLLGEAIGVV